MAYSFATIFTLLTILCYVYAGDNRRPFYNIGHMVNNIDQIKEFLKMGANSIEIDIQFHPNGSVKEIYHGSGCDCFRFCYHSANVKDYLEYVRKITDPSEPNNYANQLIMLSFDLKLKKSQNKTIAGKELAENILNHLWTKDGSREHEVRALLFINSVENQDVIPAFMEEFKSRGVESRLHDVGYDGGSGKLEDIQDMFARLGVEENIWQGDGILNCFSFLYPDTQLKKAVAIRDSPGGFIHKVHHWSIDDKCRIRESLKIGVDGIITNVPDKLLEVLDESDYKDTFRLATPDDDPFAKYEER